MVEHRETRVAKRLWATEADEVVGSDSGRMRSAMPAPAPATTEPVRGRRLASWIPTSPTATPKAVPSSEKLLAAYTRSGVPSPTRTVAVAACRRFAPSEDDRTYRTIRVAAKTAAFTAAYRRSGAR